MVRVRVRLHQANGEGMEIMVRLRVMVRVRVMVMVRVMVRVRLHP